MDIENIYKSFFDNFYTNLLEVTMRNIPITRHEKTLHTNNTGAKILQNIKTSNYINTEQKQIQAFFY